MSDLSKEQTKKACELLRAVLPELTAEYEKIYNQNDAGKLKETELPDELRRWL